MFHSLPVLETGLPLGVRYIPDLLTRWTQPWHSWILGSISTLRTHAYSLPMPSLCPDWLSGHNGSSNVLPHLLTFLTAWTSKQRMKKCLGYKSHGQRLEKNGSVACSVFYANSLSMSWLSSRLLLHNCILASHSLWLPFYCPFNPLWYFLFICFRTTEWLW